MDADTDASSSIYQTFIHNLFDSHSFPHVSGAPEEMVRTPLEPRPHLHFLPVRLPARHKSSTGLYADFF